MYGICSVRVWDLSRICFKNVWDLFRIPYVYVLHVKELFSTYQGMGTIYCYCNSIAIVSIYWCIGIGSCRLLQYYCWQRAIQYYCNILYFIYLCPASYISIYPYTYVPICPCYIQLQLQCCAKMSLVPGAAFIMAATITIFTIIIYWYFTADYHLFFIASIAKSVCGGGGHSSNHTRKKYWFARGHTIYSTLFSSADMDSDIKPKDMYKCFFTAVEGLAHTHTCNSCQGKTFKHPRQT